MGIELTCSAKKAGIHISQARVLVWMHSYRGPGSNVQVPQVLFAYYKVYDNHVSTLQTTLKAKANCDKQPCNEFIEKQT